MVGGRVPCAVVNDRNTHQRAKAHDLSCITHVANKNFREKFYAVFLVCSMKYVRSWSHISWIKIDKTLVKKILADRPKTATRTKKRKK